MNFDDYICDGQMSMFDFMKDASDNADNEFNPLKSLVLHGTGIRNGMKRIKEYFLESHTLREKVAFLKKEYGTGGFGLCDKKPCYIHEMCTSTSQKLIEFEYYDENIQNVKKYCSWVDLANIISEMVAKDEYVYKDGD